jgi:hypothetical protein
MPRTTLESISTMCALLWMRSRSSGGLAPNDAGIDSTAPTRVHLGQRARSRMSTIRPTSAKLPTGKRDRLPVARG